MKLARHPWNIFNRPSDQNLSDDCIAVHLMPASWRSSACDSLRVVFWKRLYLVLRVIFLCSKGAKQKDNARHPASRIFFFSPSYNTSMGLWELLSSLLNNLHCWRWCIYVKNRWSCTLSPSVMFRDRAFLQSGIVFLTFDLWLNV